MEPFCPGCGRQNRPEARFCDECGLSISPGSTAILHLLHGRYQLESVIKSGGMGTVFMARDVNLGVRLAIKRMTEPAGNREQGAYARRRFRTEARTLAGLYHRGLPRVTDFFVETDTDIGRPARYMVMEFIEGSDLEGVLKTGVPLDKDRALNYLVQLLEILDFLHCQDPPLIFRDVKPSNVIINNSDGVDRLYLVDFGLVRAHVPKKQGTVIGTPGYAPPEQYKGFASPASDIYSAGALAHYMLTGIDPKDPANPPFSFKPIDNVEPAVSRLVLSMVRMDPARRPQSCRKVIELIADIVEHKDDVYREEPSDEKTIRPAAPLDRGRTLVHRFVERGEADRLRKLLKEGADVNLADDDGWTPLHYGATFGQPLCVEELLRREPDLDRADREGKTPLYRAVAFESLHVAAMLISAGADLEKTDTEKGWTPLHLSVENRQAEMVELLISRGAKVNPKDKKGRTPLDLARRTGRTDLVNYLEKKGGVSNSWF